MAAVSAYLALLTLLQLLDTLKLRHKYELTRVDPQQIKNSEDQVLYLLDFLEILESRPSGDNDPKITLIYAVALALCEVLDIHVVDQIRRAADVKDEGEKWLWAFRVDMIRIIDDFKLTRSFVNENGISELVALPPATQPPLISDPSTSMIKVSGSPPKVVGFEQYVSGIKDELISSHVKSREVISIVGMGGIGKTTLAQLVYNDGHIQRRFEKKHWVTVSQEYDLLRILQGILDNGYCGVVRDLGTTLYHGLKGHRYLIVLDDMWDLRAWEDLRQYFPDDNQGSRIIVTTRDCQLAAGLGSYRAPYNVRFLDKEKSWELFCDRVFGGLCCPRELETLGRQIVNSCRGLPLGILTIAGMLSKSDKTCEYWSYVSKDVASLVNLEDNECCKKVLSLSYNCLPLHLKPIFLYIGGFIKGINKEDNKISLPGLIDPLVALSLVRPLPGKQIHQVAKDYMMELFQRNLIFIRMQDDFGEIYWFGMHDLLQDLCLKEITHEKLFAPLLAEPDGCTMCIMSAKNTFYRVHDSHDINLCGRCEGTSFSSIFWNMKRFSYGRSMEVDLELLIWNSPQLTYLDLLEKTFPVQKEGKVPIIFEELYFLEAKAGVWMREMANTMPSLKNLDLHYFEASNDFTLPPLLKTMFLHESRDIEHLSFPQSLRELRLEYCNISCREVNMLGTLPNLEKLTLYRGDKHDDVWNPIEGGFRCLRELYIFGRFCYYWRTGSDIHFPQLEVLRLCQMYIREIPRGLRNIVTLIAIKLFNCHPNVVNTARWILKQQKRSGNDQLRLVFFDHIEGADDDDEDDDDDDDDEDDEAEEN